MSLLDEDINIEREELEVYTLIHKIQDNLIRFKFLCIGIEELTYRFEGFDIKISGEQLKLFKQLAPENILKLQPFILADNLYYTALECFQQIDNHPKNVYYTHCVSN